MVAWAKRYSSISLEELGSMTPLEMGCYCEELNRIIKAESATE